MQHLSPFGGGCRHLSPFGGGCRHLSPFGGVPHGFLHRLDSLVAGRMAALGDCLMCGRPVAAGAEHLRLRGDLYVHTACATYRRRRRTHG